MSPLLLFDSQRRRFVGHLCQEKKKRRPRTRSAIRAALSSLPRSRPHFFTYLLITVVKAAETDCHCSTELARAAEHIRANRHSEDGAKVNHVGKRRRYQRNADSWLFFMEKEESVWIQLPSCHFLPPLSCSQGRGFVTKCFSALYVRQGGETRKGKVSASKNP